MSRSILMVCAAAVLCSASALARTAVVATNDAVAVPYAAVSLDAAIAAAEKHARGNAVRADYENKKTDSGSMKSRCAAGRRFST